MKKHEIAIIALLIFVICPAVVFAAAHGINKEQENQRAKIAMYKADLADSKQPTLEEMKIANEHANKVLMAAYKEKEK